MCLREPCCARSSRGQLIAFVLPESGCLVPAPGEAAATATVPRQQRFPAERWAVHYVGSAGYVMSRPMVIAASCAVGAPVQTSRVVTNDVVRSSDCGALWRTKI